MLILPQKFVVYWGNLLKGTIVEEIWKDAAGFENYYEASNLGNIRRKGKVKNLTKVRDKDGYVVHCFSVDAKRHNVFAHSIVLQTFVGPRPADYVSRHKDGVRHNNVLTNLEYGTAAENSADMLKHNTQAKGENCARSKLSEKEVLEIRASIEPKAVLASRYNVTLGNIYSIQKRLTWKHI